MAGIAESVAAKLIGYLMDPVVPHCGYVMFTDRYVRELDEEVENLVTVKGNVQHDIEVAQRDQKRIREIVEKWMEEANTATEKARLTLAHDGGARETCFCECLPNLKERYRLGGDAKRTAKVIKELIPRGHFASVAYENDPPGCVGGANHSNSLVGGDGGNTITDSRASIFEGIIKALDDEKVKVIGVYGAGGVGKTTLLKEVEKKLRKDKRPFHMIAYSKVSQTPDLKSIQNDIAYAFGVKLGPSEVGGRDFLSKKLKEDPTKKVLIILDDLWDKLDLEAVGIPSGDESAKCKLLLTSRDESVLEQRMDAHPTFHLTGLSDVEAFRLFEETYGDKLKDDEGLKAKAAQVVAKLAGLPLLIESVAKILKRGDESTWDNALKQIRDSDIKKIVQLSYGHLESDETKYLFLLCGFIGGSIPVELLLGLGVGLGLLSSRSELNEMLRRLRSICLLQDDGDDEKNVTIHDLYSEAVISTPSTVQNSLRPHRNTGSWPKEKLEKCWVCLVNVGRDVLAELSLHWFPDSKIFMLSKQHDERDCDGLDFTSMKELRVLYLRSINFSSLRSSIEIVENLQSLYLHNCDVEDVAILGSLKKLQILSFTRSTISMLPKEIGKLTKLKLLNLNYCYKLRKIQSGVFKGLINLEELYMRESFHKWMGEDGAKLAELKSLTNLTALEISIPDHTVLLEDGDLPFVNLIRFWIRIGNAYGREFKYLTTMMLNLEKCDHILSKEWVQKALQKTQYLILNGKFNKKNANELCSQGFPKLEHLKIRDCSSIEHIVSSSNGAFPQLKRLEIQDCSSIEHIVSSSNGAFPQLKRLEIQDCSSIEHIVSSSNGAFPQLKHLDIQNCSSIKHIVGSSSGAFPLLESLYLKGLGNLEKICDGPECFGKLKAMRVVECDRLECIWCLSHMHRLAQLEEIKVRGRDSMRAIAIDDARKDIVVADNMVQLPNLLSLELAELPKMTSFCIEAGITSHGAPPIQVWFPRLESLKLEGLLDLEKILYGQPPSEYSNLKSIEIRESKSTSSSILKSDWIVKLPNLESLDIWSSPSAEVVFNLEELQGMGHVEILSRLTTLELYWLPNLRRICKLENAQLRGKSVFRNLKELKVGNTGLAFLFPVSVAKCLRGITKITVDRCEKMKALVVDEDGRDEGTNDIIEFPLLERLAIYTCPMIKSFSCFRGKKVPITLDSQDAYSDSFFDSKVSLPSLKELSLCEVGSFKSIWSRELPQSSFDNFAKPQVSECSELLNDFSWILHKLTEVVIEECPSLETVFECGPLDSNTMEQTGVEPVSETIRLSHVVKSDSQMVWALPNLRGVKVFGCPKLRYLFPYAVATTLKKLDWLFILNCEQMMEVVTKEGGGQSKEDVLTFPFLTWLAISQCPNFRAFISNPTSVERPLGQMAKENDESQQPLFSEMVTFPSLNRVEIGGVRVKELWSNQTRDISFCKLISLELMDCDNIQCIAPSDVWKRLQRSLKILEVKSCRSIEIIDEGDATVAETGPLRSLVLHDLENLRHIWRYDSLPNINVPFPNLMDIEVVRCPRLTTLFETFTASFLGHIQWLEVVSCEDMELIADHGECEGATSTTITFSELDALELKEMPKFRGYLPEKYHVEFPSHMRAFIRVGCGKEPDQSDGSDLYGWERDRRQQRAEARWS